MIEADLSKAQVIGVPDDIAGEIPVAVVKMPTKEQIIKAASDLGSQYSLGSVYTLEELCFKSFPATRTGKIQKSELKAAVLRDMEKHRQATSSRLPMFKTIEPTGLITPPPSRHGLDGEQTARGTVDLVSNLSSIVVELTGSSLTPEADVRVLMDSVTILRYCGMVRRRLGHTLYFSEVLKHPTLALHAEMLHSREESRNGSPKPSRHGDKTISVLTTSSALSANGGSDSIILDTRLETAASRVLERLNIDRSDVQEVFSVKANYVRFVSGHRPQTYRHRMIFSMGEATVEQVHQALELSLAPRPILRTLLVDIHKQSFFHLVIRDQAILSHIIQHVEVSDQERLDEMAKDDSAEMFHAQLMMQARIITVLDSGKTHLLVTYNHSVFDFLSIDSFHQDINRYLCGHKPDSAPTLDQGTPFKHFIDLHDNYADSTSARASVQALAHRLRGISKTQQALWPPQRAPGWMIGTDASAHPDVVQKRASMREHIWERSGRPWDDSTALEFKFPRLSQLVSLPGLRQLHVEKGIQPQTVAIAALAIFNCLVTGQSYALFNTIHAGRSWPFVPSWMEGLLPPAASVEGPTIERVLNMIRVDLRSRPESRSELTVSKEENALETVGDFLERIQGEQHYGDLHAHAPWDKVLEALGPEEGRLAADAAVRQTFNWDASLGQARGQHDDGSVMKLEDRFDWPDA